MCVWSFAGRKLHEHLGAGTVPPGGDRLFGDEHAHGGCPWIRCGSIQPTPHRPNAPSSRL